ncbi:hypothetical protein C8R46DRAFT_1220359 [Mycena filopes]|nr:hypothetical protein C8R46DRAFT_1220359 [Mycena filopes]
MSIILAALDLAVISAGPETVDKDGRHLALYVDPAGAPYKVLVVGRVLRLVEVDDGLKLLVLLPPALEAPTTRSMFSDQHVVLNHLLGVQPAKITRFIVDTQVWCQGTPDLYDGAIYVRISSQTVFDISTPDASSSPLFSTLASELPTVSNQLDPVALGSLVCCVVEMFRVDMPVLARDGSQQGVFSRAYGLNSSSVVRFTQSS